MRLGAVDTQRPLCRAGIQSCPLFVRHAVICEALPVRNDHVRRYRLGGVDQLCEDVLLVNAETGGAMWSG